MKTLQVLPPDAFSAVRAEQVKPTGLSSCSALSSRPLVLVTNGLVQESIWGQKIGTCTHAPGTFTSFSCSSSLKLIHHWKKKLLNKSFKIQFIPPLLQELSLAHPGQRALILGPWFFNPLFELLIEIMSVKALWKE